MEKADVIPLITPEPEVDVIPPILPQSEADELPPQQQNHNENLPDEIEPEVDTPAAQEKNYIDILPFDVLFIIFQCLSNADIAKTALTCKRFQEVVETPQIQMHLAENFAFGPRDWKRYFGDVGETPQLPDDIVDILKSPCPFWTDMRVLETHLLVLIPQTVDGIPLTLNSLRELIQRPQGGGYATNYHVYPDYLEKQLGDQLVPASYWILLTKDVIPNSREKTYTEQQALLEGPYAVPGALEIATGILMHYTQTVERLYSDNHYTRTFTRCQETLIKGSRVVVGSFGSFGLNVHYGDGIGRGACGGLSGVRKL